MARVQSTNHVYYVRSVMSRMVHFPETVTVLLTLEGYHFNVVGQDVCMMLCVRTYVMTLSQM